MRVPANVRLSATAVAAAALLASPLALASSAWAADDTVDPSLVGLYGSSDPTYDGVFRQSLAILGLSAAEQTSSEQAAAWLLDQQCADGGFTAFNPAPDRPCLVPDPANYVGEDTNSTAVAVQALVVLGRGPQATKAVDFLMAARNADGGWPYIPGGDSDPNSTGLVLMALNSQGKSVDQDSVDYLTGLQTDCSAAAADQGAFASPFSAGSPDLLATVQTTPGLGGLSLAGLPAAASPWDALAATYDCPVDNSNASTASGWAGTWLVAQAGDGAIAGGNASWAVLSLAATRAGKKAAMGLYEDIESELGPGSQGQTSAPAQRAAATNDNPGTLGLASLSGAALGQNIAGFAARISATETVTGADGSSGSPSPSPDDEGTASPEAESAVLPDTGGDPTLVVAGALLVAVGAALVLATRRRGARPTGNEPTGSSET